MRLFQKQIHSIISIFLLILGIAISVIGISSWVASSKQLNEIDSQYTTIAIHAGMNYEDLVHATSINYHGYDSMTFQDGTEYIGPLDAESCAKQSPDYIQSNQGILLSAHVDRH